MKQPIDPSPLPNMDSDRAAARALVKMTQALSRARDRETVAAIVRRGARQLTGADGAAFILREGEQCYYIDEDAIAPLWKGQRFPITACISGWVMRHRQSVVIEDVASDSRLSPDVYHPTFVKSLMIVPVRAAAPIAAIGNYWARRHRATPQEIERLEALAESASIAMENIARLTELTQCAQQAEEAVRVKSQFVSNVSHELRTPINSILGYAALLRDEIYGPISSDQIYPTDAILRNARELLSLVESILDLSRMDAGRLSVQTEFFSLSDLLKELLRNAKPFVEKKALGLKWRMEPLPPIWSDAGKVRQVLTNLLSNAIKFTHGGEISIYARNLPERAGVEIAVSDTGIGIGAEEISKIFDPFYQIRLDSSPESGGVGLGLSIVKELVGLLQGEIRVQSAPGRGSTFTLFLPYRSSDAKQPPKPPP